MKHLTRKFNLRTFRICLLAYAFCDFLAGYGGFFPGAQVAAAQTAPSIAFLGQKAAMAHNIAGLFMAPAYATWQGTVLTGNSATGSQSIIVTCNSGGAVGVCSLADGYSIPLASVFNTTTAITLMDANQETVTPSGVTGPAPCPAGFLEVGASTQCVTVTATFANTHGASAVVVSGDAGVGEALTDAGASGGGIVFWDVDTGIVTLNTGAATTTTATNVPASSFNVGASGRVTTTITGCTGGWSIGVAGGSNFTTPQTTLTAGTTAIGKQASPAAVGTTTGVTPVTFFCTTANATAGALKARVWGFSPVEATQ